MTNQETQQKIKPVSVRKYVCCPNCGTILLQAEIINNSVTKCSNCEHKVFIEIDNGRVVTKVYENN